MNADVEKALDVVARKAFAFDAMVAAGRITQELADESLALADGPIESTDAATIHQALLDQEAEIAGYRALLDIIRTGKDGKKYDYVESRAQHMVLVATHLGATP